MGKEHLKTESTFEATADEHNGFLLALCAWREARGEGKIASEKLESMRAVMHVVRNRVAAGWGDWDAVITGRNQFSSLTVPGDSQLVVWPDEDNSLWLATLGLANTVYHGRDVDPTNGALYYANTNLAAQPWFSPWFKRNIIQRPDIHPVTAVIRNHTFYR